MPDNSDSMGLGAGIRGGARSAAISDYVDNASTGAKAPTPSQVNSPPTLSADKQHPGLRESAAYKPTDGERATHVYGAPIDATPALHK